MRPTDHPQLWKLLWNPELIFDGGLQPTAQSEIQASPTPRNHLNFNRLGISRQAGIAAVVQGEIPCNHSVFHIPMARGQASTNGERCAEERVGRSAITTWL